ncbi:TPA: hypothetical protein TUD09_002095 [Streptococcus equi subsp. zooepidemicus]|uniref:Uncharacterized protein n=1 Tax=Streptococcus equi subsp. ruminatorum CECT 5772 TaxID=1051981 RepID=A0A922NTZ1_9STRE|nr:hypothetical protein [Streptococcus equi]HEL0245848.1 hypothetical protein [Streptococcus equi subsp. zooepidemicus]HEL1010986.1 hypothetical protein [Streptococcus equi subsp. ruminatorum]KED03945.1 hypothetical protein CECT5772_07474 [Streptococcus equi subsp. ruminatorum CECT 5772]HEL0247751.1 hypothetical protein [Streptococcus equi subsp. zooepidemicus]HEL1012954.1 hypothetical protein [Streptococcus equi subsp. ruminatorum]
MKKYPYYRYINSLILSLLLLSQLIIPMITVEATTVPTEKHVIQIEGTTFKEVSEDDIIALAIDHSKMIDASLNLTVSNIVKIYNSEDVAIGYSVGYLYNGNPYGYAIFDFRVDGFITEFSIAPRVLDMYTQMVENGKDNGVTNSTQNGEKKIYQTLPLCYNIVVGNNTVLQNSDVVKSESELETEQEIIRENGDILNEAADQSGILPKSLTSKSTYKSQDEVMTTTPSVMPFKYMHEKTWNNYIFSNEAEVEGIMKKWGCAISALEILARSTGLETDLKTSYNALWKDCKTSIYSEKNGVSYGSVQNDDIGPAFVRFAARYGKKLSYDYQDAPDFSFFTEAIDEHRPVVFSYDVPEGWFGAVGHCVPVEGYMDLRRGTAFQNFLYVANDWWEGVQYINYHASKFIGCRGISWKGVNTN